MPRELDIIDKQLLDLLQQEVPLVDRPFEQIGQKVGLSEAQVLERVAELKRGPSPVIRQIGAIFDRNGALASSSLEKSDRRRRGHSRSAP